MKKPRNTGGAATTGNIQTKRLNYKLSRRKNNPPNEKQKTALAAFYAAAGGKADRHD